MQGNILGEEEEEKEKKQHHKQKNTQLHSSKYIV
jgi:hypothetical protein